MHSTGMAIGLLGEFNVARECPVRRPGTLGASSGIPGTQYQLWLFGESWFPASLPWTEDATDLLLYAFSDRMPATYDTFLYYEIFDAGIMARVLGDLETNRPEVVVIRMQGDAIDHRALGPQAQAMTDYLVENYEPAGRFGDYLVAKRKENP